MLEALSFEQKKGEWALYEAGITTGKLELPGQKKDVITVGGNLARGVFYYHTITAIGPIEQSLQFMANIRTPLAPFQYTKPKITGSPLYPDIEPENVPRIGYHPLTIAHNIVRGPNHWHQQRDALVCAVNTNGVWETRCFPKGSIPEATWQSAVHSVTSDRYGQLQEMEKAKSLFLKRKDVYAFLLQCGVLENDADQLCKPNNMIIRASTSGRSDNAVYLLDEIRRGYLAWINKKEQIIASCRTWPDVGQQMPRIVRQIGHRFFESGQVQFAIESFHNKLVLEK